MASSNLMSRLAVAGVGIPVVLGLVWVGGWPLGLLAAAVAGVGVAEFYELARLQGGRPFGILGVAATVVLVLLATAWPAAGDVALGAMLVILTVTLGALAASVWLRWPDGAPLASVGATVAGVVYVGCTLAFIPILRDVQGSSSGVLGGGSPREAVFLLLPLLATWAGDSAAYFAGRAWGRAPLAPSISPGKTIVGAIAGLVSSGAAAAVVLAWAGRGGGGVSAFAVPVTTALWMGLVLGAAGQIGDLVQSVLKREAGLKDSGRILRGHGGVLDRMDSLLFAIPVTWILLLATGIVRQTLP
jgi:phosphatidate cytidylyltransferase